MNEIGRNNRRRLAPRGRDGQSVASILCIGVIGTIWVGATMQTVMPTLQKSATIKFGAKARAAADAAMDYAISSLSTGLSSGNQSSLDATPYTVPANNTTFGPIWATSTTTQIAPSTLGISDTGNITVQVTQYVLAPPGQGGYTATQQPMIWNAQIQNLQNSGQLVNPYRLVTVGATIGNTTKLIRCILRPISITSPPNPGFALYGANQCAFVGSCGLNSYMGSYRGVSNGTYPNSWDPRVGADYGSGTTANQVGYGSDSYTGMALGGSQLEFCSPVSTGTQAANAIASMYNATPATQAPWCTIYNNLYSNYANCGNPASPIQGQAYPTQSNCGAPSTGYIPSGWNGTTASSAAGGNQNGYNNLLGLGNTMGTYPFGNVAGQYPDSPVPANSYYPGATSGQNMGGLITNAQQYAPPPMPIPPGSPSGTSKIGTINVNGGTVIFQDGAPPATSINVGPGQTVTVGTGNYSITGLQVTNGGQIIVNTSSSQPTPTNFYLEGNVSTSASNPAVMVSNNSSINMNGMNLPSGISGSGFNLNGLSNGAGNIGRSGGTGSQLAISPTPGFTEQSGSAAFLNLYYQGPGSGTNTSGGTAGSPTNPPSNTFAFYGQSRMTVTAPNTNILIGNGSATTVPTQFFGQVYGNWITVTGPQTATNTNFTAVHFDMKLKPIGVNGLFVNPNLWSGKNANYRPAGGYRAVTWQEANINTADIAAWGQQSTWQ